MTLLPRRNISHVQLACTVDLTGLQLLVMLMLLLALPSSLECKSVLQGGYSDNHRTTLHCLPALCAIPTS